ncbi:MAG TPA: hypothetical protein VGI39_26895, partial [Polyangiaceae bacterium]
MRARRIGLVVGVGMLGAAACASGPEPLEDGARPGAPRVTIQGGGCSEPACNDTTWNGGAVTGTPVAWTSSSDGEIYALVDTTGTFPGVYGTVDVPSSKASSFASVVAASAGGNCSYDNQVDVLFDYTSPPSGSGQTCKPIHCFVDGTEVPRPLLSNAGARCVASYTPAIYVRTGGEADVVAMRSDSSLVYSHALPGGAWVDDVIAGAGTTFSAPSVFVRTSGEADVVAEGPNHSLVYRWAAPGSAWSTATIAAAGTTFSAPSIFVRANGEADVVAQGPAGSLLYYWATPGSAWNSFTIASGGTMSAPSIFVRSGGEADVVARGVDGTLLYYWATPGSAWSSATIPSPGPILSAPSVFVRGNGEADVVAQGLDGSLYYYWASPGTSWGET